MVNTTTFSWHGTPAHTMARKADWPSKLAGDKPTDDLLTAAASILKRTGTAKHLALAMYLRDGGATQIEVAAATGDTGVNAYSDAHKLAGWQVVAVTGRNGHKAYALALPKQRTSKAKGKRTSKAKRNGKVKVTAPVEAPADEANS